MRLRAARGPRYLGSWGEAGGADGGVPGSEVAVDVRHGWRRGALPLSRSGWLPVAGAGFLTQCGDHLVAGGPAGRLDPRRGQAGVPGSEVALDVPHVRWFAATPVRVARWPAVLRGRGGGERREDLGRVGPA